MKGRIVLFERFEEISIEEGGVLLEKQEAVICSK